MALPVWPYWEGDCPAWIRACRRTVFDHAPEVRLLGPDDFDRLRTEDRDFDLSRLHKAHRADYIRAFLLARHGGLWIDSDCLVVRPLDALIQEVGHYDFLGYYERQGHVSNNSMGARPQSPLAAAYYDRIVHLFRSGEPLEWLSLGSHSLTPTLQESGIPWRRIGYELISPICWSNPAAYFVEDARTGHDRVFNERSLCYMLWINIKVINRITTIKT